MFGLSPLIVAVENGYVAVVQLLLGRHNISPNAKDDRGRTALWYAAHGIAVRLLERKDIDLNIKYLVYAPQSIDDNYMVRA
jgi:ankyrin repeat protein